MKKPRVDWKKDLQTCGAERESPKEPTLVVGKKPNGKSQLKPRMTRTIICTVGTSIAGGCPSLKGFQGAYHAWDEPTDALNAEIKKRLTGFDLATEKGRTGASAEINSLNRLCITADDEVILLVTDTADGRYKASALSLQDLP
jgi:hypothetical protein